MPFCPQCGNALPDTAAFCGKCGTQQVQQSQPQPVATPVPQPVVTPAPQPAPTPQPVVAPTPQPATAPVPQDIAAKLSDLEVRQKYASLSAAQVLPMLYTAEQTMNAMYPYIQEAEKATNALAETEENKLAAERSVSYNRIGMITMGVIAVITFLLTLGEPDGFFAEFLSGLFNIFAIFFYIGIAIVFLIAFSGYKKAKKYLTVTADQEIASANAALAAANEACENVKRMYPEGTHVLHYACPKDCRSPQLLRVFVSYIETGRATNVVEAQRLYDDYVHREAMEMMAYEQVQHSIAAENAALEARSAAQEAATKAEQARNAANTAAWVSFWK